MKNLKKSKKGIIVILAIFVCIVTIVFLLFRGKTNKNYTNITSDISNINEAYNVKTCLNKFYQYCKDELSGASDSVYYMLDKEYIKKYNLSNYNFKKMFEEYQADSIQLDTVYKIQQRGNVSAYIVKYKELYKNSEKISENKLLIKIDTENNTFCVSLQNYINDCGLDDIEIGKIVNIKLDKIDSDSKEVNKFDVSEKRINDNVNDIFKEYVSNLIFYSKQAYDQLDLECKNLKYNEFEMFDKYITDNIYDIVTMTLKSYKETQKDGYIEYECTSNTGQVYVFKVKSFVTYTVIIK